MMDCVKNIWPIFNAGKVLYLINLIFAITESPLRLFCCCKNQIDSFRKSCMLAWCVGSRVAGNLKSDYRCLFAVVGVGLRSSSCIRFFLHTGTSRAVRYSRYSTYRPYVPYIQHQGESIRYTSYRLTVTDRQYLDASSRVTSGKLKVVSYS